ncbi:MAG: PHP domain-containing protein [Spirochaetaceae bacterium]|nr:PHP domain-containing protein [Spirochaetaceae bacterium]
MKANMHLHSQYSDGSLSPQDIARSAASLGIELAAVTDHDTMGGSDFFTAECARLGIQGITGCEIDVVEPSIDYKSELLAYFPDKAVADCPSTARLLSQAQSERKKRIEYYIYWAQIIFKRPDLSYSDILRERMVRDYGVIDPPAGAADGAMPDLSVLEGLSWSKVDLFLYLRCKGLIPSFLNYRRFKKEWFVPGRFPKYRLSKPKIRDVVHAVHEDDGFVVVPHIGHLWNDEIEDMENDAKHFDSLLSYFREAGVDGIELYWYSGKKKTQEINDFVEAHAKPAGFLFTYGSDCHGPGTDKCTIDKFWGDFVGFGRKE